MPAQETHENVSRLVDPGGEIGRTARIRIGAAHQATVRGVDAGEIGAVGAIAVDANAADSDDDDDDDSVSDASEASDEDDASTAERRGRRMNEKRRK